jgi:hypothetical protein
MVKRPEDFALLSFDHGVLYNNVFAKDAIQNAFQQVFLDGNQFGWEWDWPENTGPSVKTYPEVILGRSPWNKAEYGSQFPCLLEKVHYSLDGDKFFMMRFFNLPVEKTIKVGIVAQAPTGKGGKRFFENFSLEQKTVKNIRYGE